MHYSSIINGGIYPKPKIFKNSPTLMLGRKINKDYQNIILNALETLSCGFLDQELTEYKFAGKTGTSQVRRISNESDGVPH